MIFIDMKKVIVEDCHGNLIETVELETKILTEKEVKEHVRNAPKADVQALFAQGYRKLEDICRDIENGNLQSLN